VTVVAVVQARLGSTRLPGKVLAPIAGRPMLEHVAERVCRIPGIDRVVIAIPEGAGDDRLAEAVSALPLPVTLFRGSEDDVLARYAAAARAAGADVVVRVTADCPLLSPRVAGEVVARLAGGGFDYVSNTLVRTFPRGLDTEAFTAEALFIAEREAVTPAEREHVTPFLWRRPERFRLDSYEGAEDHGQLRWTVDTTEDLTLVRTVFVELEPADPAFDYPQVLEALARHPEWLELNRHVEQKPVAP